MNSINDIVGSIIKKLFVQFRFNFEYLGLIETDSLCPYYFLLEDKKAGKRNLDGSEITILKNGKDPFGLDRICHMNSLFAYGYPMKTYIFKDDGYEALNHVTVEAFPLMYGIGLFDILGRQGASPLVFPTDFNFYEESLTKQFLITKKYNNGYILPIYHPLHKIVFTKEYFNSMNYNPGVLDLKYSISNYPSELKENILILNFALTMLFNIILVESAFVDVFGYKELKNKIKITEEIKQGNEERLLLLYFLFSCLHSFAYAVTYGIFRNRYGVRNDLPLKTPHGSFYFGTDKERKPFKEVLYESIKCLIEFKYLKNTLEGKEKEALLWLSSVFGIGYWTNLAMYDANKHFWESVDYQPRGVEDKELISHATEDSPLWRMIYNWCGPYWGYADLIEICRNNPNVIEKQLDDRLSKEVSKMKLNFIYESSRLVKEYILQELKDANLSKMKRNIFKKKLQEIWNIS